MILILTHSDLISGHDPCVDLVTMSSFPRIYQEAMKMTGVVVYVDKIHFKVLKDRWGLRRHGTVHPVIDLYDYIGQVCDYII